MLLLHVTMNTFCYICCISYWFQLSHSIACVAYIHVNCYISLHLLYSIDINLFQLLHSFAYVASVPTVTFYLSLCFITFYYSLHFVIFITILAKTVKMVKYSQSCVKHQKF